MGRDFFEVHKESLTRRTSCKYGDCNLEKLEIEFIELKNIWSRLEENWAEPIDFEDLYRVYPLLDTTAALSRKRLGYVKNRWSKYKVEVIEEATQEDIKKKDRIDTSKYLYPDEPDFYYGNKKAKQLNLVVSTILHADEYEYHDTRTDYEGKNNFEIYVYIRTDKRREFVNIKEYVLAQEKFIKDEIDNN